MNRVDDRNIAGLVARENLGIKRLIKAVIHAQHDGHDRRLVVVNVAMQPQIDGSVLAAADFVAADARMKKHDVAARKTGKHKCLDVAGVEALLGNAVAIENHAIAINNCEIVGGNGLLRFRGATKEKCRQNQPDSLDHEFSERRVCQKNRQG